MVPVFARECTRGTGKRVARRVDKSVRDKERAPYHYAKDITQYKSMHFTLFKKPEQQQRSNNVVSLFMFDLPIGQRHYF